MINQEPPNQGLRSFLVVIAMLTGVLAGNLPMKWLISWLEEQGRRGDLQIMLQQGRLDHLGMPMGLQLFFLFIPFILALVALLSASFLLLHKKPLQLVGTSGSFRWKRALYGGALWLGISLSFDIIYHLIRREAYVFDFQGMKWLSLNLWLILLLPLQTGAEEFFFRGFLMDRLGAWKGQFHRALWIPAILFTILHLPNREVQQYGLLLMLPQYLAMALFFGYITLKEQGLEMAWGIHFANNWYGLSLVNMQGSSIATPSLFTMVDYKPLWGLVGLCCSMALFLWFRSLRENSQPHQS